VGSRHPQLRIGTAESVPEAKALALGDAEALTSLAAVLLPLMEKLQISGDRILNFDESPFVVGNVTGGIFKVVLSKNIGSTSGNVKKSKKKSGFSFQSHVTAAVTVSATGEVFCPLLLVDKQTLTVEEVKGIPSHFWVQGTSAPFLCTLVGSSADVCALLLTEKGSIDQTLFYEYILRQLKVLADRKLLPARGQSFHALQSGAVGAVPEGGLLLVGLPANTTSKSQPLDRTVYRSASLLRSFAAC
jgi:hypothetical protein